MPKRIISDEVIKIWDDEEVTELMNAAKAETDAKVKELYDLLEEKVKDIKDIRAEAHKNIDTVRTELEKRAKERIKEIEDSAEKETNEVKAVANVVAEAGKNAIEESEKKDKEIDTLTKSNAALKGVVTKLKNQIDKK